MLRSDRDFLHEVRQQRDIRRVDQEISHWASTHRVLPKDTPFPGYWRNDRTPYLVEPMNAMSPSEPVQHVAIMKGCQLGFTAAAENIIGYFIGESPAPILYVSATDDLLERWVNKRLEPLIYSCGLRDKIFAQHTDPGSRRTGNKLFSKEFVGGSLDMASAQSAGGLRSESKRVLIRDEVDGAPPQLKTGEGSWMDVSYGRTSAWGARKKVLDFSTPTLEDTSLIKIAYELGDQRRFEVPCPYCGTYQFLEWDRIRAERKGGELVSVRYECAHCSELMKNYHKDQMLKAGRWKPTAVSSDPWRRSYQISSLYSPVGMLDWVELYRLYDQAQLDPDGMRSFVNLYLGKPYRERGSKPKTDKVIELRGGYHEGTVPHGVLFLTMGVDVQAGSSKDPENPPRLELEVCGHGAGFKTWSIVYKVFPGSVGNPAEGAWLALTEWAKETELRFFRSDGRDFQPKVIFIDSGDGNFTDVVYRFCATWGGTFPSKGYSALRKRRQELGDEAGIANFKRYRAVKLGEDSFLYEISTNYYKTHIYNNLKIERVDDGKQKPGFCSFPMEYPEKYFRGLTAEEKHRDGSFHCPSGRRNEPLDVRVMNMCAADAYLDSEVLRVRANALQNKADKAVIQSINHRHVLEYMERVMAPLTVRQGDKLG